MRRFLIIGSVAIAGALAIRSELAAAQPPRVVAFVVGVQTYALEDLNKLRFTAQDAQDVFRQLQEVAELDLDRSLLLLSGEEVAQEKAGLRHLRRSDSLSAAEIRSEFRRFLSRVESDDTIVVYLGGHGTEQADEALFLPSNYSRDPRNHFIRLSFFVDEIRAHLEEEQLRDVNVALFANMCGAGAGALHMAGDEDLDTEFVKDWLGDHFLGFERFAFVPATAPRRNTHEDPNLGRSVFAHHLLAGLRGAGAEEGTITTGSLFKYLDIQIADELPRNSGFDETINLGTTSMAEGQLDYSLGTSLLGLVQDAPNEAGSGLLAQLARHQFQEAYRKNWELGALAKYREAQAAAVAGAAISDIEELLETAASDPSARQDLKETIEKVRESEHRRVRFESLEQMAEYLREGGEFYALMIDDPRLSDNGWEGFLRGFEGLRSLQRAELDSYADEAAQAVRNIVIWGQEHIENWAEESGESLERPGRAGDRPHLFLVVDSSGAVEQGRMFPLGWTEYRELLNSWPDSVTLVHLGPLGGHYIKSELALRKADLSLFLGAREVNGMTFASSDASGDTSRLMIEALRQGVANLEAWDDLQAYRAENAGSISLDSGWVLGTPVWVPDLGETIHRLQTRDRLRAELPYLRRWAVLNAFGCGSRSVLKCWAEVNEAMVAEAGSLASEFTREQSGEAPELAAFQALKSAAATDLAGDTLTATSSYDVFLRIVDRVMERDREELKGSQQQIADEGRRLVDELAARVRERRNGLQTERKSRIVFAGIAVNDYAANLIVDLERSESDIEGWRDFLLQEFGESVKVRPTLIDPQSADDMLTYLEAAVGDAEKDDLLVLVFSGRGYERSTHRYLVPASAQPSELLRRAHQSTGGTPSWLERFLDSSSFWRVGDLVDLDAIAAAAKGQRFLAIYDTQFTRPVLDTKRLDPHFDKHLDSVRPAAGAEQHAAEPERLRLISSAPGLPARQVHIWWEGPLTEQQWPPSECVDDNYPAFGSRLSLALVRGSSRNQSTYRDWASRVRSDPCLSSQRMAAGTLVFQGNIDSPPFAGGPAAELVGYFGSELELQDLNLRHSLWVAEELASRFPRSSAHLSAAAILYTLAGAYSSFPDYLRVPGETRRWLDEALARLKQVESEGDLEPENRPISLELRVRILIARDQNEEARRTLLDSDSEDLANPALIGLLIELTELALKREPASIVSAMASTMDEVFEALGGEAAELHAQWNSLVEEAVSPQSEPYRITVQREGETH